MIAALREHIRALLLIRNTWDRKMRFIVRHFLRIDIARLRRMLSNQAVAA